MVAGLRRTRWQDPVVRQTSAADVLRLVPLHRLVSVFCVAMIAAGCASRSRPPLVPPATPAAPPRSSVVGLASFYGEAFHGKTTASGVPFDMNAMVAAHPTYPFGTIVRVTHIANGRRVTVRIVDRGPAPSVRAEGVLIDLSRAAAAALGFIHEGRARVRIEIVRSAPPRTTLFPIRFQDLDWRLERLRSVGAALSGRRRLNRSDDVHPP